VLTVLKSEGLNLLEPSGPVQASNGIALLFYYCYYYYYYYYYYYHTTTTTITPITTTFRLLILCGFVVSSAFLNSF